MNIEAIILAAGLGSRLGNPNTPKSLTLVNGSSILERQLTNLVNTFGKDLPITVLVGYREDLVKEEAKRLSKALGATNVHCVTNANYASTNTSQSLLKGLQAATATSGMLWLNGDVVFDEKVLELAKTLISSSQNFITVNTNKVSDEEIKYSTNDQGHIVSLSKQVPLDIAEGEGVGINYVNSETAALLKESLATVDDQDYFEVGIEKIIEKGAVFKPYNISIGHLRAYEVDFPSDLVEVKRIFSIDLE